MQENKNVVEEALIQMKQVEEAIAENAKGILQSTMKEEISQLVKESLSEQEELDLDAEVDSEEEDEMEPSDDEMDADNEDFSDMDIEMDVDMEDESDEPIDLRNASDEEILKVFKAMGEEDGIIVKKDGEDLHLTDNDTDSEYLVKLGESEENEETMHEEEMVSNDEVDDVIQAIFAKESEHMEGDYMEDEMGEEWGGKKGDDSKSHKDYMDEQDEDMDDQEDDEEVVYEIEFNEEDEDEEELEESDYMEEMDESDDMEEEMDEQEDEESYDVHEAYNHKKSKKGEHKEGKKMSVKPKGVGIGKGPKFDYKKESGGFKEDKKEAPKSIGTGKPKFSYKDGENLDGKMKSVKKETKEAARTYGMGSKEGRGLRKGVTNNRNYVYKNGVTVESLEVEVDSLREKNEEYRKALNVFRDKLNEVAIFNSNLAYATRLFTEHSTTKKEKINILRRFDNVESLKDSKNLYRQLKEELSKSESQSINESVGKKIVNTPSTGSSTTLIESKTYENPQFMRIKDLISKIN
jgi:hypothetical protein